MKEPSWVCTLATQVSLCLALFLAFNIDHLQNNKSVYHNRRGLSRLICTLLVSEEALDLLNNRPIFSNSSYVSSDLSWEAISKGSSEIVYSVKMEKPSWVCTLATQVALCFALFLAFNMSHLQNKSVYLNRSDSGPLDLYFISVRGGFRPLKQQNHLLKQMAKVAKAYKAKFVVNISELGEDDPLTQNGTWHFPSLKVPWYTTRTSRGPGVGYFLKQIKIPYGETLDIIAVDTGSLQDFMLTGLSSGIGNSQLHWLTRALEAANGIWRIVIGFHPLAVCEANKKQIEANQVYEPIHRTFLKFGVNAYLGAQGCTNYAHQGSIAYIGNPGPTDNEPYFTSANGREMSNGFLLHRVSSLEIETHFVTSAGEIVYKTLLQQR